MPMSMFVLKFPEIGETETRVLHARDFPGLPDGDYAFAESYCDERGCDCRRAIITVITLKPKSGVWATINYGWESMSFYERWMGDKSLLEESQGPGLDPLNRQTEYAPILLDVFKEIIKDEKYVLRLKRHYEMFKATIKPKGLKRTPPKLRRGKRRR